MMDFFGVKDTAYWLAYEDYVMRFPPGGGNDARFFFLWRTVPCVVIGRNQIAEAEVDVEEARRGGVPIVRRSSGGGAVYQDPGSVQYTLIQPYAAGADEDFMGVARNQAAEAIARVLKRFGVPAVVEGRNDITANGAKISGISQFLRGGWLNTHGTLLYDTDLERLGELLIPDAGKFESKAVKSVRSRVANIRPIILERLPHEKPEHGLDSPDTVGGFMRALDALARKDAEAAGKPYFIINPDADGLNDIQRMRKEKYANPANTFDKSPPYTYRNAQRFPQGKVEFFADIKDGTVLSCAVKGDFIGALPVDNIEEKLCGCPFRPADFDGVLGERIVRRCLGGISKEEFLKMIFN